MMTTIAMVMLITDMTKQKMKRRKVITGVYCNPNNNNNDDNDFVQTE